MDKKKIEAKIKELICARDSGPIEPKLKIVLNTEIQTLKWVLFGGDPFALVSEIITLTK